MHVLALEGLLAVIHSMANRVDSAAPGLLPGTPVGVMVAENQEYVPFWTLKCENYKDPSCWVEFVQHQKYIKRRLMIGADHFNRDPKKGLEFLQGIRLLPEKLDPQSVACFFRCVHLTFDSSRCIYPPVDHAELVARSSMRIL
jgi:brefeldin A-resistance guanine nucleotide exchange factor 1